MPRGRTVGFVGFFAQRLASAAGQTENQMIGLVTRLAERGILAAVDPSVYKRRFCSPGAMAVLVG